MKHTIVCVFAHPDDEAFGPGGTIARWAQTDNVYILSATKGEAGQNSSTHTKTPLQEIRMNEMIASAKELGVNKVIFLNFVDGTLSNNQYHKLADSIQTHLEKLKPDIIMTYEPRGISGHVDHITVSLVTTYVFYKLPFIKQLYYYCLSEQQRNAFKGGYFIYRPPGYKESEITEKINTEDVWDIKRKAMNQHQSQIHDIKRILENYKDLPKVENFIVLTK